MKLFWPYFMLAAIAGLLTVALYGGHIFAPLDAKLTDVIVPPLMPSAKVTILNIEQQNDRQGVSHIEVAKLSQLFLVLEQYHLSALVFNFPIDREWVEALQDRVVLRATNRLSYSLILPVTALAPAMDNKGVLEADVVELPPPPLIRAPNVFLGHGYLHFDGDGIVRHVPPVLTRRLLPFNDVRGQREHYRPLGIEAAMRSGLTSIVAAQPEERFLLAGGQGTITRISLQKLATASASERRDLLDNKIVFLDVAHSSQTTVATSRGLMDSTEIQAQLTNMFISNKHLLPLDRFAVIVRLLLAALVPAWSLYFFSTYKKVLVFNFTVGALYFVTTILLAHYGQLLPVLYLEIAWCLSLCLCGGYERWWHNSSSATISQGLDTVSAYKNKYTLNNNAPNEIE